MKNQHIEILIRSNATSHSRFGSEDSIGPSLPAPSPFPSAPSYLLNAFSILLYGREKIGYKTLKRVSNEVSSAECGILTRAQVKSIVVRTVLLRIYEKLSVFCPRSNQEGALAIRRCNHRGLMAIDGIVPEEPADLFVNLPWPHLVAPLVHEMLPHAPRPKLMHFAKASKNTELFVRHAHVRFVRLDVVLGDRFELGGRRSVNEVFEDGKIEVRACPLYERFQVRLGYSADGVDVCAGAVILGQIPS
jgi:hypothetical protein